MFSSRSASPCALFAFLAAPRPSGISHGRKKNSRNHQGCTFSLMSARFFPHDGKRQIEEEPAASAPGGRRAASRGLWHLRTPQPNRSHVSDRGRRPGVEDRVVFLATKR